MSPHPVGSQPETNVRKLLVAFDVAAAEYGRIVGVRPAARLVGVTERRIVQAIRKGELKATRLGKDYVIRISDLRRYLQRRRPRGRPRRRPGRPRKGTKRSL